MPEIEIRAPAAGAALAMRLRSQIVFRHEPRAARYRIRFAPGPAVAPGPWSVVFPKEKLRPAGEGAWSITLEDAGPARLASPKIEIPAESFWAGIAKLTEESTRVNHRIVAIRVEALGARDESAEAASPWRKLVLEP